jgi:hypothetical protein
MNQYHTVLVGALLHHLHMIVIHDLIHDLPLIQIHRLVVDEVEDDEDEVAGKILLYNNIKNEKIMNVNDLIVFSICSLK